MSSYVTPAGDTVYGIETPEGYVSNVVLTPEKARKLVMDPGGLGIEVVEKTRMIPENPEQSAELIASMKERPLIADSERITKEFGDLVRITVGEGRMFALGDMPLASVVFKEKQRMIDFVCQGHAPHPFQDGYVLAYNCHQSAYDAHSPRGSFVTWVEPDTEDPGRFSLLTYAARRDYGAPESEVWFWMLTGGRLGFTVGSNQVSVAFFAELVDEFVMVSGMENDDVLSMHGMIVLTAQMMLNTKFVDMTRIEVPDKLNKARRKAGKPLLPPYYRVDSTDYVTAISSRYLPAPQRIALGGTHGSPLPHMRRAHLRTLPTKQVMVREARVNMHDGRIGPSERSFYSVKKA